MEDLMLFFSSLKLLPAAFAVALLIFSGNRTSSVSALVIFLVLFFVILDIADGRIAVRLGKDSAQRRIFDSASDVVVVNSVCLSLFYYLGWSLVWYIPLVIRDLIICGLAYLAFSRRVVVFPNWVHKAGRLLLAGAAIAMLRDWHGGLLLGLSYGCLYLTAADYSGLFFRCPRAALGDSITEFHPEPLTGLREFSHLKMLRDKN